MKKFVIHFLILFSLLISEQKILPTDGNEQDTFGHSVSMNSEWIAIGANKAASNGVNSGSVYVYQIMDNSAINETKLFPLDGEYNDYFGKSLSLHGDWLAVSSIYDDENGYKSGSVYIFHHNGSYWEEFTKIIPEDGSPSDRFGYAVDLHSGYLAIGSIFDDDNGEDSGSVYMYRLNDDNQWTYDTKLHSNISMDFNSFGGTLSLFGDYLAVSSKSMNNQYYDQGVVDIFKLNEDSWNYHQTVQAFDAGNYDYFGKSVDINNNLMAIGSYYDDDLNNNAGAVYLYELDDDNFEFVQKLVAYDGYANDNFGLSVTVFENWIASGTRDDDNGINSGSAYIFGLEDDMFIQKAKISPSDGNNFDEFSNSLYIHENFLIVGAKNDDDLGVDSGSAYFYEYKGCTNEIACNPGNYIISDEEECYFEENGFDCDGNCFEEIDYCEVCGGEGSNGDANLDDVLNVMDIIMIVDFILYQTDLNSCLIDLNESGIVNITDVILLLENILND